MKKAIQIKTAYDKAKYIMWLSNEVSLEQLKEITHGQYSHNSLLAMRRDWLHFQQFTLSKQHGCLPATSASIKQFIEKISHERKAASVKRYVITIANIHAILQLPDPTQAAEIQTLLYQIRTQKSGDEKSTVGFSREHLSELQDKLKASQDMITLRNLAIYGLMFECALKRSELRDLTFEQLNFNQENVVIVLQDNPYQLSEKTSRCLVRWLECLNCNSGPIFRSINRHGQINDQPLNDSSIYRILKKASAILGLPSHLSFSGQSARVGAVRELYEQGYKVAEIQSFGRWRSAVMPNYYLGNHHQAEVGKVIFKKFNKIN